MEKITSISDLKIGDIIEVDGKQFVWLDSYLAVGIFKKELGHYSSSLIEFGSADIFRIHKGPNHRLFPEVNMLNGPISMEAT